MKVLKQVWTKIARFAEALEGMDDPIGDYMFSLRKRADKLEVRLKDLERHRQSHPGGDGIHEQFRPDYPASKS
jgi:hypothetical protein